MSFSIPPNGSLPYDDIFAPFLQGEGLPFADVLTSQDVEQAFEDERVSFGKTSTSFWSPALTLWTFLSQVLEGIKSCRAAVARAFAAMALRRPLTDRCAERVNFPIGRIE